MRAELRRLHSPDVVDLAEYRPPASFGILVQAIIGPSGGVGEESFDFVICTADWFDKHASDPFVLGRHYLFVKRYDYSELVRFVVEFCSTCNAETWAVVAAKVGRLGKWEFEDYRDAVIGSD